MRLPDRTVGRRCHCGQSPCQEAVAAGVLGAEELVDELLLESLVDEDEVDSFLLDESLELASLLVEVDRLSLR